MDTSSRNQQLQPGTNSSARRLRQGSFFLHMRPASIHPCAAAAPTTLYLGLLAFIFFCIECLTGMFLMVYYIPEPQEAYGAIIRLTTTIRFGDLMRDLHRLAGECMLVCVILHMAWVFVRGAYKERRYTTWVTGVMLLCCTLLLAFSGYLLPWDQLSYWAVTIGTGMADTVPVIGDTLGLLLRGGPDFGRDGLLRLYLLHIVAIPLATVFLLAIHYYRVVRVHSVFIPKTAATGHPGSSRSPYIPFFPDIALRELTVTLFTFALLLAAVTALYDAPLEHHADPLHTPGQTRAPWFFLWLQGALKLGDSFLMGVCFPLGLVALLLTAPRLDRSGEKPLEKRPIAITCTVTAFGLLIGLSLLGLPGYGVGISPTEKLLETFAPEQGTGPLHQLGYDNLPAGIYTEKSDRDLLPGGFRELLTDISEQVNSLRTPQQSLKHEWILMIEEWQADLKRATLRIVTASKHEATGSDKVVFVHARRSTPASQAHPEDQ